MYKGDAIHHCSLVDVGVGGGIETYLAALLDHQPANFSKDVLRSISDIAQSKYRLLHVHDHRLVKDIRGECPSIFTAHNHAAYCPSGTKHIRSKNECCDLSFTHLGCSWNHLVNGCGSRRPQNILKGLKDTENILYLFNKFKIPIITNSEYVRVQLIKNGISPKQVETLYYGISLPKTNTAPLTTDIHREKRILFAGRIVPDKGLEWLLKALNQTDEPIHLDIAGDGWYRPEMEKLAARLDLNKRVSWHGWCNSERMAALYQTSFAVIFPSLWPEPAGLVSLEAYAHYRPVIASAVGGIPEHVKDRITGILVPSNDIKYLASAITALSEDFLRSRDMGQCGHEWLLKDFTIGLHIERLQKIYEKVIENFDSLKY